MPFKKWVCLFLRQLPLNKNVFYKDYKFNGPFRVVFKSGESFKMIHYKTTIENEVFWKGIDNGWEKISIGLWKELSKQSNVILDIGANTGVYSLVSSIMNPKAKVYSFEPSKRVHDKLKENVGLNQFKNIKTYDVALSNKNGEAIFYDVLSEHQYSASLNSKMLDESKEVKKVETKVKTSRLEDFVVEEGIEQIDLIKLDVEKHEKEVIEGMGALIDKFRPVLFIEILDDDIASYIENVIRPFDYLYFNIDEENPPMLVSKLKKSAYYNYLFCSKEVAKRLKLI